MTHGEYMSGSALEDAAVLGAIFEATVDAIIVSDKAGRILRANKAAYDLFGHEPDSLVDRSVSILMPDIVADAHDGFMARHLKTGMKRIIDIGREVEGQRRDGTVFPLHLSVGRTNAKGQPIFVAILHDLTQRVATERALSRSQRLDALGQMTGGISHDFNNLLTIIIGNLELLQPKIADATAAAMLTDALEAAELGADLTERLTMFARRGDLKAESFDLNHGCEMALGILRRTLGDEYRIEADFDRDLPPVMVDPTQLQTAIVNLALNAKDAMPDGGKITINTELARIDDTYVAQEIDVVEGTYIRLSVTDTGTGMSPNATRRAFEPFFTTKPLGRGTGLGLAMVHGFMRQTGGHVTVYSELDHGSTFALYFPVEDGEAAIHNHNSAKEAGLRGNGQLVLVVDDNPQILDLSVERIAALGYRTAQASDGDAAYRMLTSGLTPDLLFSDVVMPGTLDGCRLAQKVRNEFPDIRILLTSGYAEDAQKLRQSFEILQKPYRQVVLAEKLQTMLGNE